MEGKIFLVQPDNSLIPMNETSYEVEDRLQRFLEDHSDLLAGDQIDSESPRRFLLVYREFGIPDTQEGGDRWSLDHLFLDQDAVPTFVEAKRSTDPRARREVVAQMLDYAANAIHYWPVGKMREQYAQRCTALGLDSDERLVELLGLDGEIEEFWQRAEENLRNGQVRLLFVADQLPRELQRIIGFLNKQMSLTEVLGVEVRRFVGESAGQQLNTLVPRVIGQTEAAKEKKESRVAAGPRLPVIEVSDFPDSLPDLALRELVKGLIERAKALGWTPLAKSDPQAQTIDFKLEGYQEEPFRINSQGKVWVRLSYEGLDESQKATLLELRAQLETVFPGHAKQIRNNKLGVWIPLASLLDRDASARFESFQARQHELLSSWLQARTLKSYHPM